MAVYEQTYRPYAGPVATRWAQRLVIPRYAFRQLFASRLFGVFFALCFVYVLGHAAFLYVVHNLDTFTRLGFRLGPHAEEFTLGAKQLQVVLVVQLVQGLFLTLVVGPTLVARDLHNNALALYLSRPVSKWTYIGGKFAVLASLLSAITWVAGLLLYSFNAALEGGDWFVAHLRWAAAFFAGSWALILVYSLVALAASSLLKWRPLATAATFGALIVGAPFGAAINAALDTRLGSVFDVMQMIQVLWAWEFGEALQAEQYDTAPILALLSVLAVCAVSLAVLARKVKPYEVVQ